MIDHPYISLITDVELSDDDMKHWLRSVIEQGPNGIISSAEITPKTDPVRFYKRKIKNGDAYNIVLARNLNLDEVKKIVDEFSKTYEGDFEIKFSQEPIADTSNEEIQENILNTIANEAAKRNHDVWVNEKIDEGWRFGLNYNSKQKVSPVLRNWENLGEKYKNLELKRMSTLLEIIDSMKLKLVHRK